MKTPALDLAKTCGALALAAGCLLPLQAHADDQPVPVAAPAQKSGVVLPSIKLNPMGGGQTMTITDRGVKTISPERTLQKSTSMELLGEACVTAPLRI